MKRLFAAGMILAAALTAAGCSSSAGNPPDVAPTDPTTGNGLPPSATTLSANRALFSPNQGILPYPHDAYFTPTPGVATDGTLNVPSSAFFPATVRIPGTTTTEPVVNALDGFSTQAPIKFRFSTPVNLATTAAGIKVIEVSIDPASKAVLGFPPTASPVRRVLVQDVDYRVENAPNIDAANMLVQIVPLKPLLPNNDAPGASRPRDVGYLVLVTNALKAANGAAIDPDADYATIKTNALANTCANISDARLNALCGLARSHFGAAVPAGVNPTTVVVSTSFTTQSVDTVLRVISATVAASPAPATAVLPVPITSTGAINTALTGSAGPNLANIFVGTITLPYYSAVPVAPPTGTGTEPITQFWRAANPPPAAAGLADPKGEFNLTRFNPVPKLTTQLTVPMLLGIPKTAKPPAGWPVVVYQHGITEDRGTLALIADATAQAGYVIVGIDLPLHGIMPNDPLYALSPTNPANAALPTPFKVGEPTFNVDYVNNTTLAAGPDGLPDPSGQHFINLTSTLTSRDNLRQAVANLIALTKAVPTLDLDGNPATDDIDETKIQFFGWSLGGIVGSAFVGTPGAASIQTVSLFAAGCGIMETLRQSPGYSPVLNNGLAAAGIPTGTSIYWEFVHAAQAAVEAGDGCNYAANWVSKPTLMQMIQGTPGVATKPTDRAVPNTSTLRLAGLLGLPTITTTTTNLAGVHALTRFTEGGHGTIALPASGTPANPGPETLASYIEARTELASFLGSGGVQISVGNSAILAPQ
jgi:virulence factor lipase-like protein